MSSEVPEIYIKHMELNIEEEDPLQSQKMTLFLILQNFSIKNYLASQNSPVLLLLRELFHFRHFRLIFIRFARNNYSNARRIRILTLKRTFLNHSFCFIEVCFSYFVCINMPFSIGVQAKYGKYINWISWETYGIMAGGIATAGLAHYICSLLFRKIKMPKLAKAEKQEESKAQQKESSKQLVREKIQLK